MSASSSPISSRIRTSAGTFCEAFVKARTSRSALLALAVFSSGCQILGPGYIGPIQPPVLDVPVLVTDLRAAEYGDQIIAAFTIPAITTEGKPLKSLRSIDLYAGPGDNAGDPNVWVRAATHYSIPAAPGTSALAPGPFEYRLPAQPWIGKDVILRVRSAGPKGKVSLWGQPLVFNVIAPIPKPTNLAAQSLKDGVRITWQGPGPKYRVLRSTGTESPQPIADTDKPEYLDEGAQFGMTYQYLVLAMTDDKHQSLISDPLPQALSRVDVFPPDVPTGLVATAGVNAIELEWDLNTEADFKGYNVYRSVDNGAFEKVASLIPAATYHDANVQAGKTYRYQVSAVDQLNNESQRCMAISITMQ